MYNRHKNKIPLPPRCNYMDTRPPTGFGWMDVGDEIDNPLPWGGNCGSAWVDDDEEPPLPRKRMVGDRPSFFAAATSSAAPTLRPLRPDIPGFALIPNDANGDCQFWAFAQALNGYGGAKLAELKDHLETFNLVLGRITAGELRELTYMLFLLPFPELDECLAKWRLYSMDASMQDAYHHARFLQNKRIDSLTLKDRGNFFYNILNDASQTWGDETSLMILERLLPVRVDVLTNGYLQIRDQCHPSGFQPIVYIVMNLSLQHYECVLLQDADEHRPQSAWAAAELPPAIVALHRTHCHAAKDEYISLVVGGETSPPALPPSTETTMMTHYTACQAILTADSTSRGSDSSFTFPDAPLFVEAGLASVLKTVEADGGTQYAGKMGATVTRLQCGLAIYATPLPEMPVMSPDVIPNRVPYANPARLWA
jgi:hypothetical protein